MFFAQMTKKEEEDLRSLFDEDPEQIQKDLEYLKGWLEKQPHLPHDMDNTMLLNFLRGRRYSLEKTKEKLDKYFTYKGILPEFCHNLDPLSPDLKFSLEHVAFYLLPGYTPEGYRVIVGCYEGADVATYNFDLIIKRFVLMYDMLLSSDTLKRGVVLVLDFTDAKAGHVMKITIPHIKKTVTLVQEGYPDQFKMLFIMGLNTVTATVIDLFIQFMKEKLKRRVVFLKGNNFEELYGVVPRKMLPSEYGGSAASNFEINKQWNKELVRRREWLVQMGEKKADEAKRPGKPKTATELLGIEGSFRKLDVD